MKRASHWPKQRYLFLERKYAMNFVTKGVALLTALELFYIFYLETVITSSAKTARVFQMSEDELSRKNVKTLFRNQGVYNGLLGVLLILASFVFPNPMALICLFLYIILVAIYGSLTSNPKIILMQDGLPLIGLLTIVLSKLGFFI